MDIMEGIVTAESTANVPPSSSCAALVVDGRAEFNRAQPQQCNRLQSLPFSMDFTGPAMVSKFFQTEQFGGIDGLNAALFRGHLLLGKTVKPPEGFAFYAAKEIHSVEGTKTYKLVDSVPSMDVWEYDEPPESRKKSLQNALVALQVASDLSA